MSAKYVGAIDQGTSSTRFMLFDADGEVVARAQAEHTQIYPKPGWVEHDALEIWERTKEVIARALGSTISPEDVAAIGITNQRETTIVWDKATGRPLHNAIVWNCTRTDALAERTAARFPAGKDHLRSLTGLPIVPYFSATKLVWLFENVPGVRDAALAGNALFGTIDTWLIWNLTGRREHVTDVSNGSRTLLMNIHTLAWDPKLLEVFGVPPVMLPRIVPSSTVVGTCDGGVVPSLANVRISGILGDQHAATFGQVCFAPGQAKATYGTGAFIMMNTGYRAVESKNGLLTTVGWQLGVGSKSVCRPRARGRGRPGARPAAR
jgi:glycerol kinase